jgi:carbonic anhydrase/acetyltransferase-like protein (isoleucine patch superfamily)
MPGEPRFGPLVGIDPAAWVHERALIYGKVRIGPLASVWPHAVIRAEMHEVRIGRGSNVQDFAMIHVGYDTPTVIGEFCSVTHHATIHGARLGDRVLIGINATVMDGAVIGDDCIVAGNALVREGAEFPAGAIIAGVPARQVATRDNREANLRNAEFYIRNAQAYAAGIHRMEDWPEPPP